MISVAPCSDSCDCLDCDSACYPPLDLHLDLDHHLPNVGKYLPTINQRIISSIIIHNRR